MTDGGVFSPSEQKMTTRAFDLNIEEVLENWKVEHALREIIANALDALRDPPHTLGYIAGTLGPCKSIRAGERQGQAMSHSATRGV
jgi:hypothetical protein